MKILLGLIILIAFAIRAYHLNYNTAFIDEAQYITEGLKILGGNIESGIGGISWIGGFPFMFPFLTAVFYSLGGLLASRGFTVILGTVCVYFMYQFTKQLVFFPDKRLNEIAGLIAASFMAVTTIAITTSRLAIYDGLAFTLFFAAVILFHKAIYTGEQKWYLSSAVVFFLSFLGKYIVLIYFPFFLIIPLLLAFKLQGLKSVKGVLLSFCLPLIALTGLYIGLNFESLKEFFVNQGVVSKASEADIVRLYWEYTAVSYILFFLGAIFLYRQELLVMLLMFLSLVPLIVHSVTGNDSSVQQHTFLALIFLLPVVGALFAAVMHRFFKIGILLAIAALAAQIFIAIPQVKDAENFWPNVSEAVKVVEKNIQPTDRILAESGDSFYLEIEDKLPHDQLTGPFVFSYAGKEGIDAYVEAINNEYFHYVQLDGVYFSEEDIKKIERALENRYRKTYDSGTIRVFELNNGS